MKRCWTILAFGLILINADAEVIKGKVKDAQTGEEIIGARVALKDNPSNAVVSGLDGSFNLSDAGQGATLVCSYVGYNTVEITVSGEEEFVIIPIKEKEIELTGITVTARNSGRSEAGARLIEKNAPNVMNVMSAKAIELSPDITVANVIQRMSGVTVERNTSGEGQYAILRGMDKRYNYTLINGVKIASPDNKNRFVPLDLFPSEMLDRLEVTKSLTADMEGDGIGGAVNLVMKDAPAERQFTANISTGYNAMYFGRDFQSFDWGSIQKKSPDERMGTTTTGSKVTSSDFNSSPLHMTEKAPLPDLTAGLSYGDRFFDNKLGVMLAGSYQCTHRGQESEIEYLPGESTDDGTLYRNYSVQQMRVGAHLKLDYQINPNHKLAFYTGYMDLREGEVRDGEDDTYRYVRLEWNHQYIYSASLKGEHLFLDDQALKAEWGANVSKAYNETPDRIKLEFQRMNNQSSDRILSSDCAERRWEHNSDRDVAGNIDLSYKIDVSAGALTLKTGGLYRDKQRDSFCNYYTFNSDTGSDWENFDDIVLTPRRSYGNIGGALNYDASEKIGAVYVLGKYVLNGWEFNAGVRAEHTNQGYELKFPEESTEPEGNQKYWDVLPCIHAKYNVHENANLRLSYTRSVNRPSFFEIVPYSIIGDDYTEEGNPDLEHTVADNIDLRYEYFPRNSEQFMVGLFFKNIKDPIEYGLVSEGSDLKYTPMNYGTARNLGVEVDIMKYFNWFGVKANYTYTHSKITTDKRQMNGNEVEIVSQSRPLYGQAAHVANVSLLFKSPKYQWEGQILGCYTGKRLADISSWLDDDIWEKGYFQLDASLEKGFKCGLTVYAKASNLLDTSILRYIHKGAHTENVESRRTDGNVVERESQSGQSFMLGLRYKL